MLEYTRPYYLFAVAALIGFGLQGIVSNTGALTVVFPSLPFPIPYINGRTFHASIGIYWTFLGLLGGVFYFFREDIEKNKITQYINILFWLLAGLMFALQGSLVLRFPVGREYIEGPWMLRAGLLLPLMLLVYCLSRIYRVQQEPARKTAAFCIIAGSILILFSYLAAVIFYKYPALAQLSQFLVFHALSEMGAELMAITLICLLVADVMAIGHAALEPIQIFSLLMAASVAALAIMEYFIWPGAFTILVLLGLAFSGLHVLPLLALLYVAASKGDLRAILQLGRRKLLTVLLLAASIFYHLFAAGLIGLLLAYPNINRYLHGTYAASAHSHQALFGVFGSLAVALAIYILFENVQLSAADSKVMTLGIVLVNSGMLVMGLMLFIAGGLYTYLITAALFEQTAIDQLLRPYMLGRIAGGILYTTGSLVFCGAALRRLWLQRRVFIGVSEEERATFLDLQKDYSRLIALQRAAKTELAKIMRLYRTVFWPKRKQ